MKKWELEDWIEAGAIIGENVTAIDSFIDIAFPWLIEIGDNTVLTGTTILAHDASMHSETGYSKVGVTSIGKNCFVAHGSIILAGVTIGDDCIIGAGAVISKDIPSGSVVVGNNKIVCKKDDFIEKHRQAQMSSVVLESSPESREEQARMRALINEKGGYIR